MFYVGAPKEPEYEMGQMEAWSAALDEEMDSAALPRLVASGSEREMYFRAALLRNERVACRILSREFRSGPHSVRAFLERSSGVTRLRSLLGFSSRSVAWCKPEDFVVSAAASDSVSACGFSKILDGSDPYAQGSPPTCASLATGRVFSDFVCSFWMDHREEKTRLARSMMALVSAAECGGGDVAARASSLACAGAAASVLAKVYEGASADFDQRTDDLTSSMSTVAESVPRLDQGLSMVFTLRSWVADGHIPSLARLAPETTEARFSFLESMRTAIPPGAVDLLELQVPGSY